ncbi:MAG: hypothetical protein MJZ89_00115 [Paludibacteraceae bacterium]|nr:hypothetical protein [Paludibacteraceae bacterium]
MNKNYIYIFSTVIIALVAALVFLFTKTQQQSQDLAAMEELMSFEKEQLENEYQELAIQYDGYQVNISNDSLVELLSHEQKRVQDLLEELRITKATNARRIAELKKELATVRSVMKGYVAQIDSLDRANKKLVTENKRVREQYQAVSAQNETLTREANRLSEVVTRAAMMEVSHFSVTPLDKRDRATRYFSKIMKLQFNFDILKNVTADPGEKNVYMLLRRPDGEPMTKAEDNTFSFEGSQVPYSIRQSFEYDGESVGMTLYWPVEEILQEGTYNADFFIDGNLCGSFPFHLGK